MREGTWRCDSLPRIQITIVAQQWVSSDASWSNGEKERDYEFSTTEQERREVCRRRVYRIDHRK